MNTLGRYVPNIAVVLLLGKSYQCRGDNNGLCYLGLIV